MMVCALRLKLETYALADLPWEYMYVSPADLR